MSTQIVDYDPEAGILTSKSGGKCEADVIIAADGVNTLRATVVGYLVRSKATHAEMLEEFSDFIPKFRSFIELAPDTVNIWDMRAVPKLPTWIRGRVLLLNDAAHGTFPTLGHGAAMAVEEAATIGYLLPPRSPFE
ncbi:hypothetical protein C8J57DRAFT_1599218 [Mycena rebaudengoi]|nr:hypothetical protein C8J57DRAFT_1599218 [Mycena rebaudengoi]